MFKTFIYCAIAAVATIVFMALVVVNAASPLNQPGVTPSDSVMWTGTHTWAGTQIYENFVASTLNTGTAGVGVTVTEFGDGFNHVTRISMGTGVLAAIAGGANLAVGLLVYTFPAGVIYLDAIHMDVAIDGESAIQANTPDVGVGTIIATGAFNVLGGTSTFEDFIDGSAAADANGTKTDVTTIPKNSNFVIIDATEPHTVHFNAAFAWSAGGDATPALSGNIWIAWRFLGV